MRQLIKFTFVLFFINCSILKSQTTPLQDYSDTARKGFCGATAEYAKKMNETRIALQNGQQIIMSSPYKYILQPDFPAGSIVRCGMFRVYYEDFITSADGFNDPTEGANRRNTMCAVLSYIESVIDINDTIDIFVNRSFSPANPYVSLDGTLAFAGSEFPPNWASTSGIYNGYAFDHITTGIDPDPITYDIDVTVNFHRIFNIYTSAFENLFYYNTHNALPANRCMYDLFSVLLHEITHGMGWLSIIAESPIAGHPAVNGNNGVLFNNAFSRFDDLFLYKGDILTGTFTKMLNAADTIDPAINAGIDPLRENDIWLYNNGAPLNQPMYSGDFFGYPVSVGSLVTHLNFNYFSITGMSQYSPGYQPKYVMGPFFEKNEMRREWTLPEMRALLTLGYSLNPAFSAATTLNGTDTNNNLLTANTGAFRTNPAVIVSPPNNVANNAEMPLFDNTLINSNTPSSPAISQLTINISGLPNIADNEGDVISIMPNSLFGIRGVSSGGNNHNLLVVNASGTSVVYTPVPGFNGIAQFGFYLWDGHERGAFKTYTINVQRGSYVPLIGTNLAVNGDFEDGTEVKDTTAANLSIPYTAVLPNAEGEYFSGVHFSGGHPYSFLANWWTFGAGIIVENSRLGCGDNIVPAYFPSFGEAHGNCNQSGFNGHHPLPILSAGVNQRYMKTQNGSLGDPYFINLVDTLQQYKYYIVELDIAFSSTSAYPRNPNDPFSVTYRFTGNPAIWPATLSVFQTNTHNGTMDSVCTNNVQRRWQHVRDTIQYCASDPCWTITFQSSIMQSFVDNFSITEMANPPLITEVEASTTDPIHICQGTSVDLHAEPNSTSCSIYYVWNPGNIAGQNTTVSPLVTTTYTVIATDILDTTHHVTDTITIFVDPINTAATATTYSVCVGQSTTITATGASTYSWTPGGSTSPSVTVSPTVTTSYIVTGSNGTCTAKDTVTITVNPLPTITFNPIAPVCSGSSAFTLTAAPSGGTFSGTGVSGTTFTPPAVSSVTTYTVTYTYTNSNGCTKTATQPVTVNPLPVATFSYTGTPYCKTATNPSPTYSGGGAAGTFSASPAGLVFVSTATGQVDLSLSTAGTYTVTNTRPASGGCPAVTATATITITAPPVATFSYTGSPYCKTAANPLPTYSGGGGAGTFSASPAGLVFVSTATGQVNIASSTAGTYTVTNTRPAIGGCAAVTATATITIIPNATVTGLTNITVCNGATVPATSLSSSPAGAAFSWTNSNPAIGLGASGTGNVPSFTAANSGTTPITATITVTPKLSGCSGTPSSYTITVTPTCSGSLIISTANANTNYTASATLSTATIAVMDNITVSGATTTLTITSPDMRFLSGKSINVINGARLVVNGAWLHACTPCGTMWVGINMDNGATVQIINGSLIEDAQTALRTTAAGSASAIPSYYTNRAIFNKNAIDIKVDANVNDMSSNVIKNTVFTCRTLPAPTAGAFVTNFNTIKSALATNTTASLAPYPATLNLAGARAVTGIELNSLSSTSNFPKIGSTSSGTTDRNIFDSHDYGVYLNSSRCEVKNCTFQNLAGNQPTPCHGCTTPPAYGVGIYAPVQTPQLYTHLEIGGTGTNDGNAFYDCYRGIEVSDYYAVISTNSTLVCSSTPATFPITGNAIGGTGIYLKDIQERVLIKSTTGTPITNWSTGVWFVRNTVSTGTLDPSCTIDGHTISANSTGYTDQAILLNDVAASTAGSHIIVRNNTITDVNNGVKASNIRSRLIIYNNPVIELRYNASGTYSGVFLEGCDKAEVLNNEIHSLRPGNYGSADNWNIRGIYVKTSTHNKIFCNTLYSLGQCLVFEQGCSSSTLAGSGEGVLGNDMYNSRSGFMLRNSGVIGQQGDASTPSSNHWYNLGLNFSDGQTNVSSSLPSSSPLYCISSGASNPTIHLGVPVYSNGSTILSSVGTELSCPTTSVPAGIAASGGSGLRDVSLSYTEELKQQLSNSFLNSGFVASDWLMQDFIYNEVKTNSDLQSDSVLNEFYLSNLNAAHGILSSVNAEIESFNYSQAALLNGSFSPANLIEQNQQTFNSIFLAHTDTVRTYTGIEVDNLYEIANECAILGGNAVYQSRNLLMSIENRVLDFGDSCDLANNVSYVRRDAKEGRSMKLYPNPSQGKITLECNLQEGEAGKLLIYDLTGHLVRSYPLTNGSKVVTLTMEELQAGLYQYEVIINGISAKKDKLIIIK